MGLAVLPARLKTELAALGEALVRGSDLYVDLLPAPHADWTTALAARYRSPKTMKTMSWRSSAKKLVWYLQLFPSMQVYKRTVEGKAAFLRFIEHVK